jgi:hypothetical protein
MDAAPALFSSTFNEAHIIALAERSARPLTMQGTVRSFLQSCYFCDGGTTLYLPHYLIPQNVTEPQIKNAWASGS